MNARRARLRVTVAGLGTIGTEVAWRLDEVDRVELSRVAGRDQVATGNRCRSLGLLVPAVTSSELPGDADVVVDTAPGAAFEEIATRALSAGRTLVTVNTAALLEHFDLVDIAHETGGRILVATGALVGLDAVRAAALGQLHQVTMRTAKPPMAFASVASAAVVAARHGVDLETLAEPLCLYSGSARDGAKRFPANVNVAASVALAGLGPDATRLEIWADPSLERNTHTIEVEADSASFQLRIQNVPTDSNPGTGRLTALSVVDTVLGLVAPLRVGS